LRPNKTKIVWCHHHATTIKVVNPFDHTMPSMDKPNEWKTEFYVNAVAAILLALGLRYGASAYFGDIPGAGVSANCPPCAGAGDGSEAVTGGENNHGSPARWC
jgi:hypothetical protein